MARLQKASVTSTQVHFFCLIFSTTPYPSVLVIWISFSVKIPACSGNGVTSRTSSGASGNSKYHFGKVASLLFNSCPTSFFQSSGAIDLTLCAAHEAHPRFMCQKCGAYRYPVSIRGSPGTDTNSTDGRSGRITACAG
jgi:hypothetical protein